MKIASWISCIHRLVLRSKQNVDFSDFFPGVGWLIDRISGQNKNLNSVFSELDTFFQNVLDDHLKPGRRESESPDVVDVMIDLMKKQEKDGDSFKLTTDHLKGIISDIFLAGVNTSVVTLNWAMAELIRNPKVMKKVQDEIRTTLGEKKERITEQDLNQLHYFKLMVKEKNLSRDDIGDRHRGIRTVEFALLLRLGIAGEGRSQQDHHQNEVAFDFVQVLHY